MNPLTLVKLQNIKKKEAEFGISEEASWHAKYKDSAYVYNGGISFDLTEGHLLAVLAQDRGTGTGKSKGFAFLAYEDQRSINLAVDNSNGAQVLGRTIGVGRVNKYKNSKKRTRRPNSRKERSEAYSW